LRDSEPKLQEIHRRILEILRTHPEGVAIGDLRLELGLSVEQHQHLDRRIRSLYTYYDISKVRHGSKTLYVLVGPKRGEKADFRDIDLTTRARILHLYGERCQMCGRTVGEDHVKLQIDHKIPREWGGATDDENLWPLCTECNQGKRNFFATVVDSRVQQAMLHPSVHVRLGELLKSFEGAPVPKAYLQLVAHTHEDWEKRLRELRELGWQYHYRRYKDGSRIKVDFILDHWEPWPNEDPALAIRLAEDAKGTARKRRRV
jgi:HNH endonuclease